ncbi:MAG: 6-bladed beta-propeller [Prevotellaceae bacterium]|jgi:hypothetical protein|nr:6-bladed beta-propeller [Prevotellaceae bacterium]
MKKMKITCLAMCAFLFYNCTEQQKKDADLERIDIHSSEKIAFSELFSEYSLIFPETTDSSFFAEAITRIEKYKDRLYLLNRKALWSLNKTILCFDTTGQFVFMLDKKGQGPGEYTFLADFFIDKKDNCIVIIGESNKWLYYDLDGNYLYTKTVDQEARYERFVREFNDSLYVCYRESGSYGICYIDRATLQVKRSAPIGHPILHEFTPSISISNSQGTFYYYDGSDVIYDISSVEGEKKPVYAVDYGEKHSAFKKNLTKTKNNDEIIFQGFAKGEISPTAHFLDNGKFFAFNYLEYDSEYNRKNPPSKDDLPATISHTTFYDKKTKKSYNTAHINFDIFNGVNIDKKKMAILGCADGYFYAVIQDLFSSDEIKQIIKSKYLDETTKQSLLKMDDDSNPIILKFK